MENLGTMAPEALLEMFAGSAACAFVIFAFTIAYMVISRLRKKAKQRTPLGQRGHYQPVSPAGINEGIGQPHDVSLKGMLVEGTSGKAAHVDVSARLAGTGRDAWLEEALPDAADTASLQGPAPLQGKEVLRIVRDSATDQIWIKVAGMRYRSLTEIRDRTLGERVLAATTHVLRFTSGMVATDQGLTQLNLPPCHAVKVPSPFGALSDATESGEILRLISNPDQNDFSVQVVGRHYQRLSEVNDKAIGRCILEGATHLLQFSNGMLATDDGVRVIPIPPLSMDGCISISTLSSLSLDSQQPAPSPPALLSEQERFLQELRSQVPLMPQKPIERPSLIGSIRRVGKQSTEELPVFSLAEEIDRIFQSKLATSSQTGVDAQVEEAPDGGVRIRVGTTYYVTPDEVPDAELRDLLKRSIVDWEQS